MKQYYLSKAIKFKKSSDRALKVIFFEISKAALAFWFANILFSIASVMPLANEEGLSGWTKKAFSGVIISRVAGWSGVTIGF